MQNSLLMERKSWETLSIKEDEADPDGTGNLSYKWEISSDGDTWIEVSTDETMKLWKKMLIKKSICHFV